MIAKYWLCGLLLLSLAHTELANAQDAEEEVNVMVGDIVAAMTHNHAAADERYVGKGLRVQGLAVDIKRSRQGENGELEYRLTMESETPVGPPPATRKTLEFIFPAKARNGLADIKRGSLVVLEAQCQANEVDGGLTLWFSDAKLLRISEPPQRSAVGSPTAPRTAPYDPGPGPGAPSTFPAPLLPPMR